MPRYVGEIVTAAVISLIALYVIWYATFLPAGGGMFPTFAATCTILLAVYWSVTALLKRRQPIPAEHVDFSLTYERLKPIIAVVATIAYVVLMFTLGFFLTTALYIVAMCLVLGVRNWRTVAYTMVVVLPLIYVFFVTFLGARLPTGYAI
jgi:hypothetical protein